MAVGIEQEYLRGPVRTTFPLIKLSAGCFEVVFPLIQIVHAQSEMIVGMGLEKWRAEIRDQVLAHSVAVLQDDSGIPYHYFDAQPWRVQLYGDYSRPYGSFRWLEQKDLKKAYTTTGPKPLDFQIGYGFHKAPSNLLFAMKK